MSNKTLIITGATKGIGKACAYRFTYPTKLGFTITFKVVVFYFTK